MKEYDAYLTKNHDLYALGLQLMREKYFNIYAQMFGVAQYPPSAKAFLMIINKINLIKKYLPNTKISINLDANALVLNEFFEKLPKELPSIIFQDSSSRIVLDEKYIKDDLNKLYADKNNKKCAICGRSTAKNSFVYYVNGQYYGKSCFEENIMQPNIIKQYLHVAGIVFAQNILSISDANLNPCKAEFSDEEYSNANVKEKIKQDFLNNDYFKQIFSTNENQLKDLADLSVEHAFNNHFISISRNEKITEQKREELFRKTHFNYEEIIKYLPKLFRLEYIKSFNLNKVYNASTLTMTYCFKDLAEEKLATVENDYNDLKMFEYNSNLYAKQLIKIMDSLDYGFKNKPTQGFKGNGVWFATKKQNDYQGYKLNNTFELGSQKIFIYKKNER